MQVNYKLEYKGHDEHFEESQKELLCVQVIAVSSSFKEKLVSRQIQATTTISCLDVSRLH